MIPRDGPLTVRQALRDATRRLCGSDTPRLDAEVLLAASLAVPRVELYRAPERLLDAGMRTRFDTLVRARSAGKPVPYLTGRAEFWSLEFEVSDEVLVPRPETELLVDRALTLWPADRCGVVVDLGTGSGAIAAALAHERSRWTIVATDRSAAALDVARRNFNRLGLERISTLCADWLAAVGDGTCDVIVANPPYVAARDAAQIDRTTAFEPHAALYAGRRGLAALATIIAQARRCLRRDGALALEHGCGQGAAVRRLLSRHGYTAIATHADLAGLERVTHGRWP